jgi:hypothetical protein
VAAVPLTVLRLVHEQMATAPKVKCNGRIRATADR